MPGKDVPILTQELSQCDVYYGVQLCPNGIITLASGPNIALRAENTTAALALERSTVDKYDVILDKRPKSTSFKPADEIVKFQVHPMDPTKTASIVAQLNPTIDAALREFLRDN